MVKRGPVGNDGSLPVIWQVNNSTRNYVSQKRKYGYTSKNRIRGISPTVPKTDSARIHDLGKVFGLVSTI